MSRPRPPLVDCDIHNELIPGALRPYLPRRWLAYDEAYGDRGDGGFSYPKGAPRAARVDAWPPSGLPPGGDLGFMREQHLDAHAIRYGVLNCLTAASRQQNPGYAAALCRAVNEWQVAEWLEKEPRLRAGIVVPYEEPALAAEEIDRAAVHPGFVQVLLLVRTDEPLGRRRYRPIFEAAVRNGLPVGIHFGGGRGAQPAHRRRHGPRSTSRTTRRWRWPSSRRSSASSWRVSSSGSRRCGWCSSRVGSAGCPR